MANAEEMKQSHRYPYTYAYDWFRMAGLAESRADAAGLFHDSDLDKEAIVRQAADQYIDYYVELDAIEERKNSQLESYAKIFDERRLT